MARFLVRVDDVGRRFGDDPHIGSDVQLLDAERFVRPFHAAGIPLVLGCVPQWLSESAIDDLWKYLKAPADSVAVHGWDHVAGRVSVDRMRSGIQRLTRNGIVPTVYIPPFNAYSPQDVDAWGEAGGSVFLGGLDGKDHLLGSRPKLVGLHEVWHVPYLSRFYGRSHQLVKAVDAEDKTTSGIVVLTLHVPWEVDSIAGWSDNLAALAEALRGRCVTVAEAQSVWGAMHG